ncbi:MAG: hypothetical protein ACFFEK_11860 [Candidatus Thorarchaeota archaeon]
MAKIDWDYPEQGSGTSRIVSELIGPGATKAEIVLVSLSGILGGVGLIVYQYFVGLGWSLLQLIVGAIVAFDIGGGVVANSTSTAKRWYHREEQGFKQYFGFILLHFIHPLLITVFFTTFDWIYFFTVYGYLLVSSLIVLGIPLYLKRPVSVLMVSGAIVLNAYIISPIPGFEWFIPIFMLKLVTGHIVREEPYRPDTN